jgi:hypothetical protein
MLATPPAIFARGEEKQSPAKVVATRPTVAAAPAAPAGAPAQTTRPQPAARTSRDRHGEPRRREGGITKGDIIFIGAVAGSSMGIGAIAAGGKGVAIGAIAGGWAGYLANLIRKR